jgi:hypothetical protein
MSQLDYALGVLFWPPRESLTVSMLSKCKFANACYLEHSRLFEPIKVLVSVLAPLSSLQGSLPEPI